MLRQLFYLFIVLPTIVTDVVISSAQWKQITIQSFCKPRILPGHEVRDVHLSTSTDNQRIVFPTYCCKDYPLIVVDSSIPTLAKSTYGTRPNYVIELKFRDANISNILPGSFTGGLHYLECLDLSKNNITYIQYGIFNGLSRLEYLDLSDNNINSIFDNAFDGLSKLREVFLQNNKISFLKDNLFITQKTSLKVLNLCANNLRNFNNTVESFSLDDLNLAFNKIEYINLYAIGARKIYLNNNSLTEIRSTGLNFEVLDARNNKIESIHLTESTITKLHLSGNNITNLNRTSLAGLKDTTHLYLDHNRLSVLKSYIFLDFTNLKTLDLSHNSISNIEERSLSGLIVLNFLSLDHNNLKSIPKFANYNLNALQHLDISYNQISENNEQSPLALKTLTHLNLNHNKLSTLPNGYLTSLVSLSFLDISYNNIDQLQYGTFDHVKNLKYLNMSSNKLSQIQQHVLSPLEALEELDFSNNQISEVDIKDLLYHCPGLHQINLTSNFWECKILTEIVKYCTTKRIIVVNGHSFYSDNVRGIPCRDTDAETAIQTTSAKYDEDNNSFLVSKFFNEDFENSTFFRFFNDFDKSLIFKYFSDFNRSSFYNFFENFQNNSMYNYFNKDFQSSNFFKSFENLTHNYSVKSNNRASATAFKLGIFENPEDVYGLFAMLILVILILMFLMSLAIFILLLKGNKKKRIQHQENVELL